jgi:hypothetical protein
MCSRDFGGPGFRFASSGLREARDDDFDGQEQGSAVLRIFDELGACHVEALSCIVLGVDEHRTDADVDALRGRRNTAQRI